MQKKLFIGIEISLGSYLDFITEIMGLATMDDCSEYVCMANAHMLFETHKDEKFKNIVNNSAITVPDGISLTWGLRMLYGIKQVRVAGMDLLPDLLNAASKQSKSVFFYGGTPNLLNKVRRHIAVHYSGIPDVGVYSPPFRSLTEMEEREIVDIINENKPEILFVVLGCPKQEKWMASMRGRVNAIMIGIGAALPVLVGEQKRAPFWMQKAGLEWLYRLKQEPRRLFKRYLITNTAFILLILQEKLKKLFKD
jgi:N-acetylglucosaminyldiphosphoundecaprenol N-acetyl-beta-D-mannosaminyltransferase